VDSSDRRRWAEARPVPRSEAWAQAAIERTVELVVSSLDVNALLDEIDLNAVLDQVDLDRLLERIDLNDIVKRIDLEALVKQTDLGAIISASSSGVAGDVVDAVARWIARLRRRPYTGPPGPPDQLRPGAGP